MFTPKNVAVILIIVFIVSLASWSKLRFVDENDHVEQRWRIEDYPGFRDKKATTTEPISAPFSLTLIETTQGSHTG